jgi:aspartyl protease family protein
MVRIAAKLLLLTALCGLFGSSAWSASVTVQGLFKDAAVLLIDGQPKLVRAGQTIGAITLHEANPRFAVISFAGGEPQQVSLSKQISSSYVSAERSDVTITRNPRDQYITPAYINGRRMVALVDTGANTIAMSEQHAQQLQLRYNREQLSGQVVTAGGLVNAYAVQLSSVRVGDITVSGVPAVILAGDHPKQLLLGMSYLSHVEFSEKDGVMTLRSKY